MKFEWEAIDDYTSRAAVLGGWLVKAYEDVLDSDGERGFEFRVSMVFMPDPEHRWTVDEEESEKEKLEKDPVVKGILDKIEDETFEFMWTNKTSFNAAYNLAKALKLRKLRERDNE